MASAQMLVCAVFGVRGLFVAKISFNKRGSDLKRLLKSEMPTAIPCEARDLRVCAALENGQWLECGSDIARGLRAGMRSYEVDGMFCREDLELTDDDCIDTWLVLLGMTGERAPKQNQVHLVVEIGGEQLLTRGVNRIYYDAMRDCSPVVPAQNEYFRGNLLEAYKCDVGNGMVRCMLLNAVFPAALVVGTYLFHRRYDYLAEPLMARNDIDDAGNGLLLFAPLSQALDRHRISFIYDESSDQFRLKVCDRSLLQRRLFDEMDQSQKTLLLQDEELPEEWRTQGPRMAPGAQFDLQTTFGDVDGEALCFETLERPYRRCVYFHARLTQFKGRQLGWAGSDEDIEEFWPEGESLAEKMNRFHAITFALGRGIGLFALRVPVKLAEFWLNPQQGKKNVAFMSFNFSGVPGSDGLLSMTKGVHFDFNQQQLEQSAAQGWCWKEFYLEDGCPLPKNVELSLDGVHPTTELTDATAPSKIYVRLDQRYIKEYYDGSLDILRAVSGPGLPPLLVIHGDADVDVPFESGEELFAAAAEPKTWLAIPKVNHLLSNSKHMKKALRAIGDHIAALD